MVLHTIISEYDILYAQSFSPDIKTEAINGGHVEQLNGAVQRLISTDLTLYLNGKYDPGSSKKK